MLNAGFRPDVIQQPLPHIEQIISELLGIGRGQRAGFMAWSDDLAIFIGTPQPTRLQAPRAQSSLLAMSDYFETLLEQKRQTPGDDLVSQLAQAEASGEIQGGPELWRSVPCCCFPATRPRATCSVVDCGRC